MTAQRVVVAVAQETGSIHPAILAVQAAVVVALILAPAQRRALATPQRQPHRKATAVALALVVLAHLGVAVAVALAALAVLV